MFWNKKEEVPKQIQSIAVSKGDILVLTSEKTVSDKVFEHLSSHAGTFGVKVMLIEDGMKVAAVLHLGNGNAYASGTKDNGDKPAPFVLQKIDQPVGQS